MNPMNTCQSIEVPLYVLDTNLMDPFKVTANGTAAPWCQVSYNIENTTELIRI